MDYFIKFVPIFISFISLIISLISLYYKLPKLKMRIVNKDTDSVYGSTKIAEDDKTQRLSQYVACVMLRLYNQSSGPITVAEICLKYKNNIFIGAQRNTVYWDVIEFFYIDNNEITSDGNSFGFKELGADFPLVLSAYDVRDVLLVFPSFPKMEKQYVTAKLYADTTVGNKSKTIKLKLYDKSYSDTEWEEVKKWWKSL